MRSATSWREICAGVLFFGSLSIAPERALATPKVVADEACAYYAVDIASFATCEEGGVVVPVEEAQTWPRVVADEACVHYAVDIASFATCIGDRVAGPRDEPPEGYGHLVTALD